MNCLAKVVLSGLVIAGTSGFVAAENWPKWLGPAGTGISAETGIAESWPSDGPKKVWSHDVGIGFSSAVAVDGKVYFFAQKDLNDVLTAFNADTGAVAWTQSYKREADVAFPGTRATPTIEGSRIYTYGSYGDLVCRELADGKLVWQTNTIKETNSKALEWGCSSSPLIVGDRIFVQIGKEGDCIAAAIDKNTGKLIWKSQAKGLSSYATLTQIDVSGTKQIIVFAGEHVYAMDPATGKTIWSEPWKTDYDINAATPIYHEGKLLVTSTRNFGSMLITVTPTGHKKEWEKKDIASKFQPPILDGGVVYVNSNGVLRCVTWPDSVVKWSGTGRDLNLGAGGSFVRVGDKLITMSERGRLSLVQATPTAHKLLSSVAFFDYSQVWTMPVVYKGKLYVKGETELVCLDISGK